MKVSKVKNNMRLPFASGDPFTLLFKQRLRLNPWAATLILVAILYTPMIIIIVKDNLWWSVGNRLGFLNDYGWWIYLLTSVPATILYFFWLPEGVQNVLKGLRDNKVLIFPTSDDDKGLNIFELFVLRFDSMFSNWIWSIFCAIGISFLMIGVVPVHQTYHNWTTSAPFIFWFVEFFWFVMFFLAALLVVRGLIVILWFNRLFREFSIDVKVLHPDAAGGLSPLGAFSVKAGYLIGVYGLAVVTATMTQSYLITGQFSGLIFDPVLVFGIIVYLLLAPIAFFAPIGAAHSSMKRAKNEAVMQIANQFEADFARLQIALSADSGEIKSKLEKLEQIQKLHNIVSRFPVWPFNTGSLVRFFSSILSPLVIGFIPTIIDLLI